MSGPALSRGGQALARWLLTGGAKAASAEAVTRARLRGFVRRTRISTVTIERFLDGEVIPAEDQAAAIARVTKGAVKPADWERAEAP